MRPGRLFTVAEVRDALEHCRHREERRLHNVADPELSRAARSAAFRLYRDLTEVLALRATDPEAQSYGPH